ncbi:MAG TPA: ATP-binding protein [Ginsengibacter sp.]|nr:ATP-binding protein [Ginsengibacter sp.]
MEAIKKFVVIGPESTGKSTLCTQLAEYYNTTWVPEYAREYLEKNGTQYSYDDLLTISKGQIDLEESLDKLEMTSSLWLTHPSPILFIDTDMYVMKVWCEFVFNRCHNWILNRIAERRYDGYLLCNTDLPWVKDNLREYPDVETRNKLYHFYKDLLINQSVRWVDINGSYEERFEKAIEFINAQTVE